MANKSVKDFEFPAGFGFSGSAGKTVVKGYLRGGKVKSDKVGKVMGEFKAGELHSGSKKGPVVKDRKQAIAIAMSEAGKTKKAEGGHVAPKKGPEERVSAPPAKVGWTDYAKGGKAHDDRAEDLKLIRSEIRKAKLGKGPEKASPRPSAPPRRREVPPVVDRGGEPMIAPPDASGALLMKRGGKAGCK